MKALFVAALLLVSGFAYASDIMVVSGTSGDFVSGGKTEIFTGVKQTSSFSGVSFDMPGKVTNMTASFAAPAKQKLKVGTYDFATRLPFQQSYQPGMNVSGDGRGCNSLSGKFVVRQVDYKSDGSIKDIAIDFVQHCEMRSSAMYGALRYNSNVPVSFGKL
ncbi:MAG: hypothetical protein P1U63_09810 [Coxiellaceae bacterium]|nr:hypothetical protein [Coxiellaceae bacterium]